MLNQLLIGFQNRSGLLDRRLAKLMEALEAKLIDARRIVVQSIAARDHMRSRIAKDKAKLAKLIEKSNDFSDRNSSEYKFALDSANRLEEFINDSKEQMNCSQETVDFLLSRLDPLEELVSRLQPHMQFVSIFSPVTITCPKMAELKLTLVRLIELALSTKAKKGNDNVKLENFEREAIQYYSSDGILDQIGIASEDKRSMLYSALEKLEAELLDRLLILKEESSKWQSRVSSTNEPLKNRAKAKYSYCLQSEESITGMLSVISGLCLLHSTW